MLIRDDIKYNPVCVSSKNGSPKTYEELFVKLNLCSSSCIIGVICRPPGHDLIEFNLEIEELLSNTFKNYSKEIILAEDFNIDLLKINEHKDTNSFYNCMTSHLLIPTITRPTRITPTSASLIDNIFTNAWSKVTDSFIIPTDLSDHFPILTCLSLDTPRSRPPVLGTSA